MALYQVETKLSEDEALERAREFFGEDGLGLHLKEQQDCCLEFTGGGGHVSVIAVNGEGIRLEIETREWDRQVGQFMEEVGG
ncbi:MAG: hypothetical protein P8X64_01490 [Anaerolineales bacterium]|jgi:hypothetical protein